MSETVIVPNNDHGTQVVTSERHLFPLTLSPFEKFLLADDRADYPVAFVIAIQVSGVLLQDEFHAAMQAALERHPLLTCFVQRLARKGQCWIPSRELRPHLDWADDDRPLTCPAHEHFDLTREHGLRIWVRREATRARVSFQFHHACCDGLGAVQFIGDLLAIYGQRTVANGAEAPELEPVQPERLLERANFSSDTDAIAAGPKSLTSECVVRLFNLLRRKPVPVAIAGGLQSIAKPDLPFPAVVTRILDRSIVLRLKAVAAAKAVSLNDLYLREMFQTIRTWNRNHQQLKPHDWMRILMPTSLRTPRHDQMPSANVMGAVFLTRPASQCDRPDELLADIHAQTSTVVNEQHGRFLPCGLKFVTKIPGLLSWLMSWDRCFATAILANVGEIRRQFNAQFPLRQGRCIAGNVVLESVEGAAHIRSKTRLATSLGTYAGSLYINLHCDPRSFTRQQAEELADLFTERLQLLIAVDENVERRAA